jgi:hypothetical protein
MKHKISSTTSALAHDALDRWVRGGEAPARAARLELTPDGKDGRRLWHCWGCLL